MEKLTRRKLLGSTGVALTASVAGCNGIMGGDETETPTSTPTSSTGDFDYPEGFSESEIDVETAFGSESAMAGASSVEIQFQQSLTRDGTSQTNNEVGAFDSESQQALVQSEQTSGEETATQAFYIGDGQIFIQLDSPSTEETQYQKDTYEWNQQQLYRLGLLQQYLQGVEVSVTTVEERDGRTVAVYTTDGVDSFTSESLFGSDSGLGELTDGSGTVVVDERGYVHSAEFDFTFGEENPTEVSASLEYSNYGSTTVSRPSWIGNNEFTDLSVEPSATVNFDETPGESVDVIISEVSNADSIDVIVGQSIVGSASEAQTITVEASSYTTSDGQTAQIRVFGRREGQQPTQLASYQPQEPASSDGTTTSTPNTTDSSNSLEPPMASSLGF